MADEKKEFCACGLELHYTDQAVRAYVNALISTSGPTLEVSVLGGGKAYKVPRHYLALHGLNAKDLPRLAQEYGFEEVK
jgi:hypothetical protein